MAQQKIVKFTARNGRTYDLIEQIIEGFSTRLDYMTRKYSQVSVAHMTVRLPVQPEKKGARALGAGVTILRNELKRRGIASQAGWVREIKDGKEHFHLGFIWDSAAIQSAVTIGQILNEILHEYLNIENKVSFVNVNMPYYPNHQPELNLRSNYTIKIRRGMPGFKDQQDNIIDWLAYLAKTETKGGHEEKHIREYAFSMCRKEN